MMTFKTNVLDRFSTVYARRPPFPAFLKLKIVFKFRIIRFFDGLCQLFLKMNFGLEMKEVGAEGGRRGLLFRLTP
jgi:hypothetical protein